MTEPTPQAIAAAQALLKTNLELIRQRRREQAIRDNLTSYLRQIFPDEPGWVNRHIRDTETSTSIVTVDRQKTGFIDNLVGLTFIEYEPNLLQKARFDGGLQQIKEYASGLINAGNEPNQVIGILSDTIRWYAYAVRVTDGVQVGRVTPDAIAVEQLESTDLSAADERAARRLIEFLTLYLRRLESRPLNALTIASDLGFSSPFGSKHVQLVRQLVERAFSDRPGYAQLIRQLWSNFVGYLTVQNGSAFDVNSYVSEFYILTLAKLICANVIERRALLSDDTELTHILNGEFFKNCNLANLVEYDYFGWLNDPPYIDILRPIAQRIQRDLRAYDFAHIPQEDVFGQLMKQLANRTQRILLGQEFTPAWLSRKIVTETIRMLPLGEPPRLVDMCCGSGTMIAETIRAVEGSLTEEDRIDRMAVLETLVMSITGFDIDPLAVLLSKTTWVVSARDWLTDLPKEVSIPVYHADSLFAVTPLSNSLLDEEGTGHYVLDILGQQLSVPQYLLQPAYQLLFDSLLDLAHTFGLHGSGRYDRELVRQGVIHAAQQHNLHLTDEQIGEVSDVFYALALRIDELNRSGNNGIWSFVLRNSYRPSLVAGQFNGLVSNPPWLAMSKIARNPYLVALTRIAERYNIKPSGPSHPHLELATIFLVHAVDRYLRNSAVVGCIVPETVLNGHHHNMFRNRAYESGRRTVLFHLNAIWEIAPGTFDNRAIVLFGKKEQLESYPATLPGTLVTRTESTPLQYHWNTMGKIAIWSKNPPSSSQKGLFSPANFVQGADVLPRALFIVDTGTRQNTRAGNYITVKSVDRRTSIYRFSMQDLKKFEDFSLPATVVLEDFVFDVLMSNHVTPFNVAVDVILKAMLPIKRSENRWAQVDPLAIRALHGNSFSAFQRMERAIEADNASRDIWSYINLRNKLTNQAIKSTGYLVLTGAGGEITCSAYVPMTQVNSNRLIIDQTLYWAQVDSEDEAVYLTGLLNSDALHNVIRDFIPQGAFGGRHQHTIPYGVTPKYEATNELHQDVVTKTRTLLWQFAEQKGTSAKVMSALNPNSGTLASRRRAVKKFIKSLPAYADYEASCRSLYGI